MALEHAGGDFPERVLVGLHTTAREKRLELRGELACVRVAVISIPREGALTDGDQLGWRERLEARGGG
jgi:hypothetical protein